jgi:CRP-like cAMP-binding protein
MHMIAIMSVDLSPLFDGGSSRSLAKEESLFLTGEPVRSMFLVTEGQVDLVRHTETGLRVLLYRAGPGSVLAEASAYSDAYHCDGTAVGPALVRSVPLVLFRACLDGDAGLANAWAARLAQGLQGARMNAAIRSMRTVEERLEAWLAGGRPLPPKGQWQSLAEALGVTREALYRELSKRRPAE